MTNDLDLDEKVSKLKKLIDESRSLSYQAGVYAIGPVVLMVLILVFKMSFFMFVLFIIATCFSFNKMNKLFNEYMNKKEEIARAILELEKYLNSI